MLGLTPRQRECLDFIFNFSVEHGYSPSFREMAAAMGLASTSGVHRLVLALEKRGYIRRLPRADRSIIVIELEAA